MCVIGHGILRIWMEVYDQNLDRLQSMTSTVGHLSLSSCVSRLWLSSTSNMKVHLMAFQTTERRLESLRSEVFDADSDTVIVDISANCII